MSWKNNENPTNPLNGPPSFDQIIVRRILAASLLAMSFSVAWTVIASWAGNEQSADSYVSTEIGKLEDFFVVDQKLSNKRTETPSPFEGEFGSAYAFRVVNASGHVVIESNSQLFGDTSPVIGGKIATLSHWFGQLAVNKPFYVAGGRRISTGDGRYWIEFATAGDPANRRAAAFWPALFHYLWSPLLVTFLVFIGALVYLTRGLMTPFTAMARKLDAYRSGAERDPIDCDTSGLPSEAYELYTSIRNLQEQLLPLANAQDEFISAAAHVLRTPLGIMMLELGHINDPKKGNIEEQISEMDATIESLLLLSTLDSKTMLKREEIDLLDLVVSTRNRLESMIEESGAQIQITDKNGTSISADRFAVERTFEELLINACVHNGSGVRILVTCGPGPKLVVEDNGCGIPSGMELDVLKPFVHGPDQSGRSGLGLTIVTRTMSVHGGRLLVEKSKMGGAKFVLEFDVSNVPTLLD